jgi:hypothetical protein
MKKLFPYWINECRSSSIRLHLRLSAVCCPPVSAGAAVGPFIIMLCLLTILPSCKYFKSKSPNQGEKVIARANDEYLYLSDLSAIIKNVPHQDSAAFIANYAESWVRRKLLLKKAEENVPSDELGIDKKVEDYRQSLLLYEYEKGLINQKLNKGVSDAEIEDFYDKNKDKFTLESDIYDIQYVRIHTDAQDLDKMRPLILMPRTPDDTLKREGYAKALATSYSFSEDNWMASSTVLKQFPITAADLKELSTSGKFNEFKNKADSYFLLVKSVKHMGDPSPLDYIRNQIKEVIVNKKKVILIQKIYDGIYQEAAKSGKGEVLVKK